MQVERELTRDTSLSAGYLRARAHLILVAQRQRAHASAAEAAARGVPNLGRPDPRFGNVTRYAAWATPTTTA